MIPGYPGSNRIPGSGPGVEPGCAASSSIPASRGLLFTVYEVLAHVRNARGIRPCTGLSGITTLPASATRPASPPASILHAPTGFRARRGGTDEHIARPGQTPVIGCAGSRSLRTASCVLSSGLAFAASGKSFPLASCGMKCGRGLLPPNSAPRISTTTPRSVSGNVACRRVGIGGPPAIETVMTGAVTTA
jgi:hypothetical protein